VTEEGKRKRPRRRRRRKRPKPQGAATPAGAAGTAGAATPSEGEPSPTAKKRSRRRRRKPRSGASEGDNVPKRRKPKARAKKRSKSARSHSRRGRTGGSWWALRWSQSVHGIQVGKRLDHGRSYARQGRVIELELEKGAAHSLVQGSRDAPYRVRMHFAQLTPLEWKKVVNGLGQHPEIGRGLFRGEVHRAVEAVFAELGLALLPGGPGDLKAACSCPDQANPCKHVAAVYYAVGEEIGRDPFLMFRLRGLDRNELLEALAKTPAAQAALVPAPSEAARARREAEAAADDEDDGEDTEADEEQEERQEPLPEDPTLFWAGPGANGEPRPPEPGYGVPASGALLKRLGGFPFWEGETAIAAVMERIYRASSPVGRAISRGEPPPSEDDPV